MEAVVMQAYEQGKSAFAEGQTVKDVFERVAAAEENYGMSFAMGFADGFLSTVRRTLPAA